MTHGSIILQRCQQDVSEHKKCPLHMLLAPLPVTHEAGWQTVVLVCCNHLRVSGAATATPVLLLAVGATAPILLLVPAALKHLPTYFHSLSQSRS